jgi:hypothetical protein
MNAPDLLMIESADAFEAWAVAAVAGDRAVYAVAREFPRHLATSILAGAWLRGGLIVTVYQRQSDGSSRFIAERTQKPWVAGPSVKASIGARGKVRAADIDDDPPEARICRLIARHANFDKAAPTYREMAKAAGLGSDQAALSAARRACKMLIESGQVARENTHDQYRTRFILPDGRKTEWLNLRGGK